MRVRFRWDMVLAAVILAAGLALFGFTRRWTPTGDGFVLDRLTGRVCRTYLPADGVRELRCYRRRDGVPQPLELYRPPRAPAPGER